MARYPRTSQPQGAIGIDYSRPITRGLQEAINPVSGATAKGVTGVLLGAGTLLKKSVGRLGPVLRCPSFDNSAGSAIIYTGNWTPTPPYTAHVVFEHNDFGGFAGRVGGTWVNNQFGWRFTLNSGTLSGQVTWTGVGAGTEVTHGTAIAANTPTSATLVVRATTFDLYVNGVLSVGGTAHSTVGSTASLFKPFHDGGSGNAVISAQYHASVWNRALSDAEIKSLSDNPWQIFQPVSRAIWTPTSSAVVSITRPTSDVTTTGWTGNPDNVTLFNNIDESTASDTDYITSPTISGGESITFGMSSLAAGTWDVRYRANFVGSSAQVRIHLLDGSNVSQGVSSWQTVTSTFADYTASVTTTGAAVRVKIEVQ